MYFLLTLFCFSPLYSDTSVLNKNTQRYESLDTFAQVLRLLESAYVDEDAVKDNKVINKVIKNMASDLDPHTRVLSPSELKELNQDTSGKFGGIGVSITLEKKKIEVIDVMPHSPAEKAQLLPGDILTKIDGLVITDNNLELAMNNLRGKPGSTLQIEWLRNKVIMKATLRREIIEVANTYDAELSPGFFYIKLNSFQEDSPEKIHQILLKQEKKGLKGLILDLRDNPGGLLNSAVKLTNLFVNSGIIVSTVGRDPQKQEVEYAIQNYAHPYMHLIVLVNGGSASASEIVAGALQDHKRALIAGSTTFGKGSVQSVFPLTNGGGLKVTIGRYFTPKGRSIQAKGITPDLYLDNQSNLKQSFLKESDLKGHIESKDYIEQKDEKVFLSWPKKLQEDQQLMVAYHFMKSWIGMKK